MPVSKCRPIVKSSGLSPIVKIFQIFPRKVIICLVVWSLFSDHYFLHIYAPLKKLEVLHSTYNLPLFTSRINDLEYASSLENISNLIKKYEGLVNIYVNVILSHTSPSSTTCVILKVLNCKGSLENYVCDKPLGERVETLKWSDFVFVDSCMCRSIAGTSLIQLPVYDERGAPTANLNACQFHRRGEPLHIIKKWSGERYIIFKLSDRFLCEHNYYYKSPAKIVSYQHYNMCNSENYFNYSVSQIANENIRFDNYMKLDRNTSELPIFLILFSNDSMNNYSKYQSNYHNLYVRKGHPRIQWFSSFLINLEMKFVKSSINSCVSSGYNAIKLDRLQKLQVGIGALPMQCYHSSVAPDSRTRRRTASLGMLSVSAQRGITTERNIFTGFTTPTTSQPPPPPDFFVTAHGQCGKTFCTFVISYKRYLNLTSVS